LIGVEPPSVAESAATGERDLESFLLKLDPEQKAFVGRFDGAQPQGPWLLKGGPGSGKSTVGIYCGEDGLHRLSSGVGIFRSGSRARMHGLQP
jgi:hypothetical protein